MDDKFWNQFEEVKPQENKEQKEQDEFWGQFEEVTLDNKTPTTSKTESALRGAGQGASLGWSDELIAGGRAIYDDVKSVFTGENQNNQLRRDEQGRVLEEDARESETYDKFVEEERYKNDLARDSNPYTYGAGEISGAIGSAFIPGLGVLNAGKGARLATMAGKGALSGGLVGAGLSEADNLGDLASDTAKGAAIGGVAPVAIKGLSTAGRALDGAVNLTGKATKVLNKPIELATKLTKPFHGIDEKALARQIKRPLQSAAAENEQFAFNVGQQALEEIGEKGSRLGQQVGQQSDEFIKQLGKSDFTKPAKEMGKQIKKFLLRNQVSPKGFSALKPSEVKDLVNLEKAFSTGKVSGEDFFKFREHLDNVKNLAQKYDVEGKGPLVNFLKNLRHEADSIVDKAFEPLNQANTNFSNFAKNKGVLGLKDKTSESTLDNLFGRNKTIKQKAAEDLLTPETFEKLKDISANKSFSAQGPSGSVFGLRNIMRAGAAFNTLGASELAFNPAFIKRYGRALGRIQQGNFQAMGKFSGVLQEAAQRGNGPLATTHFLLQQNNPEYREQLKKAEEEEDY